MSDNNRIVPDWAYNIDVHAPFEYHDDEYSQEMNVPSFVLPSVAQQWKDDMRRRVSSAKRRYNLTSDHFRFRAPEEFIKTGRWPADVVRPTTISVADQGELPNV